MLHHNLSGIMNVTAKSWLSIDPSLAGYGILSFGLIFVIQHYFIKVCVKRTVFYESNSL